MLHDLLRIKKIREQSAQELVKRAAYKVEQAAQNVTKKEQELEDHIKWREQEEKNLYDDVMKTFVKERELDLIKQKVLLMREKDLALQDAITEAKKELEASKKELEEAKEKLTKAMQAVKKFEEFTRVIDDEAAKEAERIEDLELEEFTNKKLY